MNALVHAHSGLRYVVLVLILLAIFKGFSGMKGNKKFTIGDGKVALFAMISCHIQLLIGLILYFTTGGRDGNGWYQFIEGTMKNTYARFYSVEHILMMVIAIALITVGHSKSKKADGDKAKFKKIAVFYTIGLVIILASIPWPFRANLLAGWF